MPRYFIQLSYKGTRYNGWQIQDNTPHTIQQELQDKIGMVLRENIEITGCGRTDTGVHAKDFYAHFDSPHAELHANPAQSVYKFNQVLSADIAIKKIWPVKEDANSRFDASSRTYHYYLHRQKDPFLTESSYFLPASLDMAAMNEAANYLREVQDFTSFSKVNTQTKTNRCQVMEAYWMTLSEHEWVFVITADRFLRNMVRAIVGTLLEVGRGKLSLHDVKTIIDNRNRSDAGASVPAHGLFLTRVVYPAHIFN